MYFPLSHTQEDPRPSWLIACVVSPLTRTHTLDPSGSTRITPALRQKWQLPVGLWYIISLVAAKWKMHIWWGRRQCAKKRKLSCTEGAKCCTRQLQSPDTALFPVLFPPAPYPAQIIMSSSLTDLCNKPVPNHHCSPHPLQFHPRSCLSPSIFPIFPLWSQHPMSPSAS